MLSNRITSLYYLTVCACTLGLTLWTHVSLGLAVFEWLFSALELLIHCEHCYIAYSCLNISLVMKVRYREAESLGALRGRVYILAIGKMEPFHLDNGSIAVYLGCMGLYLSANSMPETKQVLFFLNLIGRGTYKLLRNLLAPDKPAEMSLVGFYETYALRTQEGGDSREVPCPLSPASCRWVSGLRSETQQKYLLAEQELTFDRALAIAQSMEAADRDAHTLRGSDTQPGAVCLVPQQHPSQRTPVDSSHVKKCYCCDSSAHIASHCRFRVTFCHNCQKKRHITKVCCSRPPTMGRPVAAGNPRGGRRSPKWV